MIASKAKKTLVIAGIVVGGFMLFGYKKINTAKEVLSNIKVGIKSISKLKLSWENVSFNVVMTLQNTTSIDFGATLTSKIIIKQVRVYNLEDVYLGKADANIYQLDLPALSTIELPEMTFNLDLGTAFTEFSNNTNSYLNQDFSNLKYKVDVEVFGNIITLEP